MCVVGLSVAFVLVTWGICIAGVIKKGFLAPILLCYFGVGGIFLSIVLLLDGEIEELPGMALIGVVLGIVLIVIGATKARKIQKGKNSEGKYI